MHHLLSLFDSSISLRYPWALVLLILPVLLLVFKAMRHGSEARQLNYPLIHLQFKSGSLRLLLTRWLPTLLYVLAITLLVIALARPVKVDRTQLPPTEGVDIILLMFCGFPTYRQTLCGETPQRPYRPSGICQTSHAASAAHFRSRSVASIHFSYVFRND